MKNKKSKKEMSDDLNLFLSIQIGKYLLQNNKVDFDSEIEADGIIGLLMNVWDDKISKDIKKLDTMDEDAKSDWFFSVEIEISRVDIENRDQLINDGNLNPYNLEENIFPELSESQIKLVPFCWNLLEPIGYKFERLTDIITGIEPSEIEIHLLRWSYEIVSNVNKAVHTKSKINAEELLDAAYDMACEHMDEDTADSTIIQLQIDLIGESKKKKRKGII